MSAAFCDRSDFHLGSARALACTFRRLGEKTVEETQRKNIAARRRNEHARRVCSPESLATFLSHFHNKKSGYVFAPDEKNLLPSRARFYRVRRASTARLGCCRGTAETSVGLLQRAGRSALGQRWSAHDAAERTALHRSGWRRLDRAGGLGRRWRLNPACALVFHGRTLRRKIPQRLRPARCRL